MPCAQRLAIATLVEVIDLPARMRSTAQIVETTSSRAVAERSNDLYQDRFRSWNSLGRDEQQDFQSDEAQPELKVPFDVDLKEAWQ